MSISKKCAECGATLYPMAVKCICGHRVGWRGKLQAYTWPLVLIGTVCGALASVMLFKERIAKEIDKYIEIKIKYPKKEAITPNITEKSSATIKQISVGTDGLRYAVSNDGNVDVIFSEARLKMLNPHYKFPKSSSDVDMPTQYYVPIYVCTREAPIIRPNITEVITLCSDFDYKTFNSYTLLEDGTMDLNSICETHIKLVSIKGDQFTNTERRSCNEYALMLRQRSINRRKN